MGNYAQRSLTVLLLKYTVETLNCTVSTLFSVYTNWTVYNIYTVYIVYTLYTVLCVYFSGCVLLTPYTGFILAFVEGFCLWQRLFIAFGQGLFVTFENDT